MRGREFTVLGRRLHTTTVLTGLVIIALGILFWSTNGLVTMPSLIPTSALARWQENVGVLSSTGAQIGVIVALALLALGLRSEEHTSELQSRGHLVCRLLLEKKKHINAPAL